MTPKLVFSFFFLIFAIHAFGFAISRFPNTQCEGPIYSATELEVSPFDCYYVDDSFSLLVISSELLYAYNSSPNCIGSYFLVNTNSTGCFHLISGTSFRFGVPPGQYVVVKGFGKYMTNICSGPANVTYLPLNTCTYDVINNKYTFTKVDTANQQFVKCIYSGNPCAVSGTCYYQNFGCIIDRYSGEISLFVPFTV